MAALAYILTQIPLKLGQRFTSMDELTRAGGFFPHDLDGLIIYVSFASLMDCPVQNYVTFTTAAECAAEVNKMRAAFGVRCRVFDGQTALWSGFSLEQNLQWLTLAFAQAFL
ncbi:MAG: hypothetical protein LR015_04930 [Verrucomicrobia bacterium]|nr:hypothetical protein [Verrucomicrobiota bacterium]